MILNAKLCPFTGYPEKLIGDAHLGCTTYTDKRISDFATKYNNAIDEVVKLHVDAIFLLGDVFDSVAYRKSVESFAVAVAEVAKSFIKLNELGIEIFVIAGNHEYGRGRRGGELRILSDLGIIHFLDDEIQVFRDFRIAGISRKSDPKVFRQDMSNNIL